MEFCTQCKGWPFNNTNIGKEHPFYYEVDQLYSHLRNNDENLKANFVVEWNSILQCTCKTDALEILQNKNRNN